MRRVRSSKMRVFSFDRNIFHMKFPSPHWLYVEIYTATHNNRTVSRRQHGSCCSCPLAEETKVAISSFSTLSITVSYPSPTLNS